MTNKKPIFGIVSRCGKIVWREERKVSWWRNTKTLRTIQIPLSIVSTITFITGTIFSSKSMWPYATFSLVVAFICMFLIFTLDLSAVVVATKSDKFVCEAKIAVTYLTLRLLIFYFTSS